ncbi:MAG: putative sulfate/molybdate transporter [Candidatus Edwardsbacteria bacterium]|nr:putative sulfate/molybdate transporter [Candidatus Edwardsbacteria bacterium]
MKQAWSRIRFDRNELSGAFGDIGTDLPLLIGMIAACGLDSASTLIMFGLMQVATGLWYGLPMPVQPLKAMAALMIANKLSGSALYGAGLAIGVLMLFLTLTGLLEWLVRIIPKAVIRGVQFGLGLALATIATKNYILSDSWPGYILASVSFIIVIVLLGNRRFPPALWVIALGVLYALVFRLNLVAIGQGAGFSLPRTNVVALNDITTGLLVLALPQIALSISNSVVATKQTLGDLFPESKVGVKKIGITYSLMNLINPWFSGVPTCHGAGGLAGHYSFGARTGGSVIIYGLMYLILGLFFAGSFHEVVRVFPLPVLGVILLFESLALMMFIKDIANERKDLFNALLVALMCMALPNGYVIGLVAGTGIHYLGRTGRIATVKQPL